MRIAQGVKTAMEKAKDKDKVNVLIQIKTGGAVFPPRHLASAWHVEEAKSRHTTLGSRHFWHQADYLSGLARISYRREKQTS